MFLQTLKTLMAKLKTSDWGALDRELSMHTWNSSVADRDSTSVENLAAYRAQTLQNLLVNALVYGVAERDSTDGQLKVQCHWLLLIE